MHRRTRPLTAALAGLALLLAAACGDDDAGTDAAAPTETTAAVSDADQDAGEEPVAGCQALQERPDGTYSAGDAGEVEIEVSGDTATIVSTSPNEGWTVEEDDVDDPADDAGTEPDDDPADETELTFVGEDDREIDVEASVVDGELVVEVCES